jgi:hypothetical protein
MNTDTTNQQFLLAARPQGEIKPSDFTLMDAPMPEPGPGEFLVEVHYLAVEPAMKGWIEARVDYIAPVEIGEVMRGQGAGVVIASNKAKFPVGTAVTGHVGWQRYMVTDGKSMPVRALPQGVSLSNGLNVLGITGLTAYFGMLEIGKPGKGDTVLVSGAAGATGSVAGQLARLRGARVIGIAGGPEKCAWLVSELGFDGAIDYKHEDSAARIAQLCPDGLDVYFDNVGGDILDAALANLADRARVVLCGGISRYNQTGPIPGPANYFNLVYRRARMEGFIVIDYAARFGEASQALSQLLASGQLRSKETIAEGFEALPHALIGLFRGSNIGKQLVAVRH